MLSLSFSLLEWLGLAALGVGLTVLFFSPYRRWLAFMLAGMGYFTFLEGIRLATQAVFTLSTFEGYLTGVALSLVLLLIWLAATEESRSQQRHDQKLARQIEHRPIECREI
ncbi:MAG: hypothetical protein VXW65_03050 [Pseudomonadota bacterium]|nr:hypothetical protein [Pseudomonadota bacterium]